MDEAELIEVIRTTLTKRGEGKTMKDPIRIITQYWTKSGELLFEDDPNKQWVKGD